MVEATVESQPSSPGRPESAARGRLRSIGRHALGAFWFAIVPALLAWLALWFLAPPVVVGSSQVAGDIFHLAEEHALLCGVGLFLAFAAVARYWRFSLPGAKYLSTLAPSLPVRARRQRWELGRLVLAMAGAALLAIAMRRFVVESYSVLSGSMLPTLAPEDLVLGYRLAYSNRAGDHAARSPRRGDIVVFPSRAVDEGSLTDVSDHLVKRVIGLPGDRISMRGGVPVINGWTVPVCDAGEYLYIWRGGDNGLDGRLLVEFLEDRAYLTVHATGSAVFSETYEVQPGELFVLGDNRNNSSDSRAWNNHRGGGVPIAAIEARAEWFIAGKKGDKRWDFGRFLRPVDSLATTLHLDGVDLRPLQEGIARCLQKRPEQTRPPAAGGSSSASNAGATNP